MLSEEGMVNGMEKKNKTVAIVLAAGQGKRMHSHVQKQYLMLHDRPVIFYALNRFQQSFIDEIILVVSKGEEDYCRTEIVEKYNFTKVAKIVEGGRERYHSVANGLAAIGGDGYVFIHDGARPFITEDILLRAYETVKEYNACVVGMPVKDTIKVVDKNCFAKQTPNRETLWQVQTPQVFEIRLAKEAYDKLLANEEDLKKQGIKITDDAMVVETLMRQPVKLVEGSYENIKITTPEDLDIAYALLSD